MKGSNDTMTSSYLYIALKSDRESDKTTRSPPNFWYYKNVKDLPAGDNTAVLQAQIPHLPKRGFLYASYCR